MTDPSKTLIAVLVDRSASMSTSKVATEKGFNQLMKDQAAVEGTAFVTLATFDDVSQSGRWWGGGNGLRHGANNILMPQFGHLETVPPVPEFVYKFQDITSVPKLRVDPRGNTPLYDAIGNFVTEVGKDLSKMREQDRPGSVIVAILTDGMENTSKSWTQAQVKELITLQENQYNWRFMFLGSNIDAVEVGSHIGFRREASLTYDDDSAVAVANAFASTSNMMGNMRGMVGAAAASFAYDDADRMASMTQDASAGRKDGESLEDWKARLKASKKVSSST